MSPSFPTPIPNHPTSPPPPPGRQGETIKALQSASEAHIVVNQDFPEGVDRQITVSGRQEAVDRAARMIRELIAGEPGSAQAIIQKVCAGGRVVGRAVCGTCACVECVHVWSVCVCGVCVCVECNVFGFLWEFVCVY